MAWAPADTADSIISTDDYVAWYGLTAPSTDELTQIQMAIDIASDTIRAGRRYFTPVTNDVVTIDAYGGDVLLLPKDRLPVTTVTLVEQLSGADYVTVDATEYAWSANGYVTRCWSCWSSAPRGVRVTYSHGYAQMPRDVAGVCLTAAKRLIDSPDGGGGVQSEQLGDHHVTFFANTGILLPEDEQVLRQYEAMA